MFFQLPYRTVRLLLVAACAVAGLAQSPVRAWAYKPTDPEVQQMIKGGLEFLKTPEALEEFRHGSGLPMLIAYAIYKVEHDPSDPFVARGVKQARSMASKSIKQLQGPTEANYEMAVAVLLLAEVDPVLYAPELNKFRDALVSGQRSHGGYGYYSERLGDTSQTQYVMLALWTLDKNGFSVPPQTASGIVRYLLMTQDPSGGWGYKGNLPKVPGQLVPQDNLMNKSLAMGAGGSLLMAGELFGFWSSAAVGDATSGLPPAFRDAKAEEERRRRAKVAGVKPETLLSTIGRLNNWLKNPTRDRVVRDYYEIYTLERYRSFLEIAEGNIEAEPEWYNAGVRDLRTKQSPNGGWGILDARGGQSYNDEPGVATSFAILFLIRSTKKSIVTLSQATARGGHSIPKDTTDITMEGGQVKGKEVAGAIDGLLGLLEADGANELDEQSIPEDLKLAQDPAERRKQLDRLERLVRGSQSYLARRVAARVLGQSGELRVVPALIFALSDPDTKVKRFARDGLRFISRRFDGFGMPDRPNQHEVKAAQQAWREWYLDLDPGYVFLDAS